MHHTLQKTLSDMAIAFGPFNILLPEKYNTDNG